MSVLKICCLIAVPDEALRGFEREVSVDEILAVTQDWEDIVLDARHIPADRRVFDTIATIRDFFGSVSTPTSLQLSAYLWLASKVHGTGLMTAIAEGDTAISISLDLKGETPELLLGRQLNV